jgi:hypothetical protein
MGVLFKSAIGLGAVYFAMFAPTLKSDEVAATAGQCANAARLQLAGDAALRAQWAAAGCALGVSAQAQKLGPPAVAAPAPVRAAPKRGALSEADLREPWVGPAAPARKSAKRG